MDVKEAIKHLEEGCASADEQKVCAQIYNANRRSAMRLLKASLICESQDGECEDCPFNRGGCYFKVNDPSEYKWKDIDKINESVPMKGIGRRMDG